MKKISERKLEEVTVPKGWGREIIIVNDIEAGYCGKILEFNPDTKFSMHFHDEKVETFWVLSGEGVLKFIDLEDAEELEIQLKENTVVDIPRISPHQIINTGQEVLKIVEFSTFHDDKDSFRVAKGASQKKRD